MTSHISNSSSADSTSRAVAEGHPSYNQGLTPLHPSQKSLIRVMTILGAIPLVIGAGVAEYILQNELGISPGSILVPVAIAMLILIFSLPHRKYRRWGYDMGEKQLRVLRGFLWRTDTIVPFNRIQHIDVAQGPLQRAFGLSTLIVHTVGTHNSIVSLPGLATMDAEAMRETIKGHIRQDMI
ncbi:transmembrane protein, distant homology with ydbS [hydrothermal vent metagenome]|uniref:Transmembrane protein, distant homology with ydbS n=1 Tax=hydrothermal vent metagenome TaxID=652676 RepID=A0A3B0RNW4_9ZZZZ